MSVPENFSSRSVGTVKSGEPMDFNKSSPAITLPLTANSSFSEDNKVVSPSTSSRSECSYKNEQAAWRTHLHSPSASTAVSQSSQKSRGPSIGSARSRTIRNQLDSMTDTELVNAVQELQKTTRFLELENMVFLNFLHKYDPSLVEDIDTSLKVAQTMQERASISSRRLTLTRHSRRESVFLTASAISFGPNSNLDKEGPKINITQKTDLILREIESIEEEWQHFVEKCTNLKHKLKAELEEMSTRETEIEDLINTFENVFILGTVEKYPQKKNPADKFVRFMEESFKQARSMVDKLRLRTSSLKVQYQKICSQLTQKKQLGENLQEVDFEQLHIENKHLAEKIDKRNLLLLELKKMHGRANLLLSRTKKHLFKKLEDLKQIQETIQFREELISKLDDECEKIAIELENRKNEYDKIKAKSENFQVPPVIDYVKTKAELGTLKKSLKIWSRRKQIKDMALLASMREMKQYTGRKMTQDSWFEYRDDTNYGEIDDGNDVYEFDFERREQTKKRELAKRQMRSRNLKAESLKIY